MNQPGASVAIAATATASLRSGGPTIPREGNGADEEVGWIESGRRVCQRVCGLSLARPNFFPIPLYLLVEPCGTRSGVRVIRGHPAAQCCPARSAMAAAHGVRSCSTFAMNSEDL